MAKRIEGTPQKQLAEFNAQLAQYAQEIIALRAITTTDTSVERIDTYIDRLGELAAEVSDIAKERDVFFDLSMHNLREAVGFQNALIKIFLQCTKVSPRMVPGLNIKTARWNNPEIVTPPEARITIARFGLITGTALSNVETAPLFGYSSSGSVGYMINSTIAKLSLPNSVLALHLARFIQPKQ